MKFSAARLEGVILVTPDVHEDNRGFFLESYAQKSFAAGGIAASFVQDNHSRSAQKGVIRGLHFQLPPLAQAKLIRATRGSIYDVVVDIRKSSPTHGEWLGFELSEKNFTMLYVPAGFAHGFCTLEEDTEVQYKTDAFYSPAHDSGIRWNDPDIGISWPAREPVLSVKDQRLPLLRDFVSPF